MIVVNGRLEVRNLSFTLSWTPSEQVLNDISFSGRSLGKWSPWSGRSGSGKSTWPA